MGRTAKSGQVGGVVGRPASGADAFGPSVGGRRREADGVGELAAPRGRSQPRGPWSGVGGGRRRRRPRSTGRRPGREVEWRRQGEKR